jgi:hypothetical protein
MAQKVGQPWSPSLTLFHRLWMSPLHDQICSLVPRPSLVPLQSLASCLGSDYSWWFLEHEGRGQWPSASPTLQIAPIDPHMVIEFDQAPSPLAFIPSLHERGAWMGTRLGFSCSLVWIWLLTFLVLRGVTCGHSIFIAVVSDRSLVGLSITYSIALTGYFQYMLKQSAEVESLVSDQY